MPSEFGISKSFRHRNRQTEAEMATTIQRHRPPRPAVDSIDPILEIMDDPDLTMGEKLMRMEALFAHDSAPAPGHRLSVERVRPSVLNARVRARSGR